MPTADNFDNSRKQSRRVSSEDYFPTPQTVAGKIVSDFYQWPVLFAVMPPLITLVYGGKVEEWSEAFMLLVVAFYLYGLVKVPWELYAAARVNHENINKVALAYSNGDLDPTHEGETIRQSSVWKLWTLEWIYFLLVFASPLGGAVFLRYIKPHLHVYQNLINEFPMALYVLTAYIRPLIHLTRLFKLHISSLQDDMHYPHLEVTVLKKKLHSLEKRLDEISLLLSETRAETLRELKDSVEPNLKGINKDLRRTTRREQKFVDYSIARFRELELRLQEQELFVARNRPAIERKHPIIFAPAYWILDSVPSFSLGNAMMLPINAAVQLTTWWVPGSIKRVVYERIAAPKRPSITDGSEVISTPQKTRYSPSPTLYPWDTATRQIPNSSIEYSQQIYRPDTPDLSPLDLPSSNTGSSKLKASPPIHSTTKHDSPTQTTLFQDAYTSPLSPNS